MHRVLPLAPSDGSERAQELVERLKVALPPAIFLIVVAHQTWEVLTVDQLPSPIRFGLGVLFYGLAGPLIMYLTLDWIAHAMARQADMERLIEANEELKALDALKDEFVALVSHELRAPLTNINASVELMLDRELNGGQRQRIEIIGQEASRLTRLVQGVLDVSRIHAGRLDLQLEPVSAEDLCRSALEPAAGADPEREWRLTVADRTPPVLADLDRAGEALGNLLDNAAKYSQPGTCVDVGARPSPDGAFVLFAVTDRGVGIPAEELERVFERFHRVERHDAKETYGHGLGLYIARRIVERHGGRMWAESEPGCGATFWFTLPAIQERPTEPAADRPTERAADRPTERAVDRPTERAKDRPTERAATRPTEPAADRPEVGR